MISRHVLLTAAAALLAFGAFACGPDGHTPNNGATNNGATNNGATNNGATNNGATNNGATNNGATNNGAEATTVTVGVFKRTGESTYVEAPVDPFVFEVGAACQSWSRRVEMPTPNDPTQEPHDHFNAADDVVYANETLSWVEYGPEHSESEIDATCAGGADGAAKTVNATDYEFDGNMGMTDDQGNYIGFYLKIISVD